MPVSVPLPGGGEVAEPSSASHALRMVAAGLGWLANADVGVAARGGAGERVRDLERAHVVPHRGACAGAGGVRGAAGV